MVQRLRVIVGTKESSDETLRWIDVGLEKPVFHRRSEVWTFREVR